MISEKRLIDEFMRMVSIDSVSYREADFRDYIIKKLGEFGIKCQEDDAAAKVNGNSGNLVAFVPGQGKDGPTILLSAHMDTVEPGKGIKPRLEGERIVADGRTILAADDKAGVAVILETVRVLCESKIPHPPLQLLFTVCEEQGLKGVKALDMSLIWADFGYVLDSDGTAGEIVIMGPSHNRIEWTVTGKAAHAGMNPEQGINAIQAAARGLSVLPCGRIDEETTCNIGVISGGTARNIVPEKCYVEAEVRSLNENKLEELTSRLNDTFRTAVMEYGADCEIAVERMYPAFRLSEEDLVVRLAVKAAEKVGCQPRLVKSGGGSDANILNARTVPVANLGMGMRNPHTAHEHIFVSDLVKTAEWVLAIVREAGENHW